MCAFVYIIGDQRTVFLWVLTLKVCFFLCEVPSTAYAVYEQERFLVMAAEAKLASACAGFPA